LNILWLQTGACSGDTMAILCADSPSLEDLVDFYQVNFLWQPSLSMEPVSHLIKTIEEIKSGQLHLDVLCIEGSIITAPNNTGMYDTLHGQAKMQIVEDLSNQADHVVALGTCASYGGVHASGVNPADCVGLQYSKHLPGGLFPTHWRSKSGNPVINLSGCPCHPNVMTKTLALIAQKQSISLDSLNRPAEFFSTLVHQGCTRNEYHEYDIEDTEPGDRGCMFFNLGCQGPTTEAICNQELWNGRNSKTRAGVPCFGCTSPDFPADKPLFTTEKLGNIPVSLPMGVERAKYMAYKSLAKKAAPERVTERKMKP